jgi:hypothetical protein
VKSFLAGLCLALPIAAVASSVGPISITADKLQIISSPQIAYLYVTVSGSGCTNGTAAVLVMDTTNPAANSMYATLLTAKTSGAQVTITTSGCTSSGYPAINSIYLD